MRALILSISLFTLGPGAAPMARAATPSRAAIDALSHTVHADQRFQVIDHFGASDAWTTKIFADWSPAPRQRVADLLFTDKGLALSQWRFNLGAGRPHRITDPLKTTESFEVEPGKYDFDRLPAERWMLAAAKRRGVGRFVAFANSPPARMTVSGFTSAGDGKASCNLKPGMEEEYARYLVDIVEHFAHDPIADEQVDFDRVSPFNEPQWEWTGTKQEGTRASNDDIKRVVRPLDRLLRQRQLRTRVLAVESGNIEDMFQPDATMTRKDGVPFGNYLEAFCSDASVSPMLGGAIAYHSYWSDDPGFLLKQRNRLRHKADRYPGFSLWQTEYCIMDHKRDMGMESALKLARVVNADLTIANASGWCWWLAVSRYDYKDGLLYTNWKAPGDAETLLVPRMFWAFAHYSRFLRPGMIRVGLDAPGDRDDGALAGSAFVDERSGRVVVVYVNSGPDASELRLAIEGDDHRRSAQSAFVTSDAAGDELRAMPTATAGETIHIPARSIVTAVIE